ncbi:MAG: hypothetical protein RLY43_1614 [Bacteroidota bacterium]|jgi:hypothetical protein
MKKITLFLAFVLITLNSFAQVSVKGYYKSNGTYVQPYQRTSPNNTVNDNYSTVGNTNPYTGKEGTKPRQDYNTSSYSSYNNNSYNSNSSNYTKSTPSYNTSSNTNYNSSSSKPTYNYSSPSSYESNKTIYTGPRGGQYYINSNGNKTYIKN